MAKEKILKLFAALRKLVGRDYAKTISYMVGPHGAFTVLIECIDNIPKDISTFARLERFIKIMSIFEENSLHFLKKAESSYKKNSAISSCLNRLLIVIIRCGQDKYKHKEHKTFVKYDGRTVYLISPYMHFPEPISFFEGQQKTAKGAHKCIVKDLEWEVQDFLKRKTQILKDDYHRLHKLFPQKTKTKKK
jgi:hypothetical protein